VELAKKFGMADSAMTPHLRRLMESGKAEKKKFYEGRTTDGRRYKKTYYRLK
jgi:DNA-binding transcriptional ArsR family regulator